MAKILTTTTKLWAILAAACVLALISSVTLAASEGRASVVGCSPKNPTSISGTSSTGDGEDLTQRTITATGMLEKLGLTTYMYGTHAITDEASGTRFALKSTADGCVDLDSYVGQRVAVSGWVVPGYPVDGGPPLLEVTEVRPAEVVDDLPPPIILTPLDNSYDTDGSLTFLGAAEAGSTVSLFEEGSPDPVGSASANGPNNAWSITLSGVSEGTHSYAAKATNSSGLTTVASQPVRVTVDTQAPKVDSVVPAARATGVGPGVNVTATFSEKMNPLSINKSTFQLFKVNPDGTETQITKVTVALSTDGLKATLNPFGTSTTTHLASGTKYKTVVTTGAKDLAGNRLDQHGSLSGSQPKQWVFTVRK